MAIHFYRLFAVRVGPYMALRRYTEGDKERLIAFGLKIQTSPEEYRTLKTSMVNAKSLTKKAQIASAWLSCLKDPDADQLNAGLGSIPPFDAVSCREVMYPFSSQVADPVRLDRKNIGIVQVFAPLVPPGLIDHVCKYPRTVLVTKGELEAGWHTATKLPISPEVSALRGFCE